MEPEAPNIANVITSAVGDLNVVGEEREVNIIIRKPESLAAAIKAAGRTGKCPSCGYQVLIPQLATQLKMPGAKLAQ